jgi:hypothetical protein
MPTLHIAQTAVLKTFARLGRNEDEVIRVKWRRLLRRIGKVLI